MPRKAVQIECSDRVMMLLEREVNRHQVEGHFKARMQMIYYGVNGKRNDEIAAHLGCRVATVRKWRGRWHAEQRVLAEYEQGFGGKRTKGPALLGKVREILSDAPRSGSPGSLTEVEKNRLQAVACESPEKYDLPFTIWTHAELSKQAKKLGIKVSASQYGRILKKQITSS